MLAASDPSGVQVLLINLACSFFGQVFWCTCILGAVSLIFLVLRKGVGRFYWIVYFQGLVNSLARFLQVRVLCRYFDKVDSHQVVCTRDYIQ